RPFDYDGVNNLMIDFSFNNATSSTFIDGQCRFSTASQARTVYSGSYNSYGDPLTWAGTGPPFPSSIPPFPNIRLTSSETIGLTPATTGNFVNGVWTGNVFLGASGNTIRLQADDGQEHVGDSNPFNIPPAPDLSLAVNYSPRPVLEGQVLVY